MSEKKRSKIADYSVYLIVRVVVCVLQMLTYRASLGLANGLAWLAYHLDKRHRLVADDNLRHAYPELDDQERDALIREVYRHFSRLLMVIVHAPRKLHVGNWKQHIDMSSAGPGMVDVLFSGRPVLLVTGHFGHWEVGGYVLGLFGFITHGIARPLDNPYLDAYLRTFRERTGQKILAKHGDWEKMQEILDRGGVLGTLGDQDAGQRGLFVNFFGRPASTHKAVAIMALEFQTPMVVIGVPSVGEPMRYFVHIEDVIYPEEYAQHDRLQAVKLITERFTQGLERLVRRHPEQYFWLHRRWKHQPKVRARKAA